eukprot:8150350-Pyramimonas_sp.AAC.2
MRRRRTNENDDKHAKVGYKIHCTHLQPAPLDALKNNITHRTSTDPFYIFYYGLWTILQHAPTEPTPALDRSARNVETQQFRFDVNVTREVQRITILYANEGDFFLT